MDKIKKIRQEIERRKGYISVTHFVEELLSLLDTLSEEPDKSLEEAAEKYCEKINHRQTTIITDSFKAGAQWQKTQMMKKVVEGEVHPDDCEIWVNLVGYGYKFNESDKVRIIIVKEK